MQRWVVEARNGHIKSLFKILDGIVPYAHVLHLADLYNNSGTQPDISYGLHSSLLMMRTRKMQSILIMNLLLGIIVHFDLELVH